MSSPKSLFSKTVSKKPRIDNEEKQENTTSQGTGRNIPSSSVKKPAFNPALLSSAFYTGPTMYGGAGACSSSSPVNQYAKSKFYDRKKSDIKVTPSAPEASMSQTSRRILDLLEQYSSPISDAKRVPINNRPNFNTLKKTLNTSSIFDISKKSVYEDSPTPNLSKAHRFRELQIPSMATLMKIKKNNRTGENSQAAIMASMSSSIPYKPETYSLRSAADNNTYKSKIKTKVSSTRSKMMDEDEMAIPVNLPNISLNMTGLPTFTIEPFKPHMNSTKPYIPDKKDTHNFNSATSNFKFTSPVAVGKGDISVEARKFQFSEPLDIFSPDYVPTQEEADTSGSLKGDSLFRSVSNSKPINIYSDTLSNTRSPIINFKSGDSDTPKSSSKRSAEQWNGSDSGTNKDSEKILLVNGDSKSYDIFGKSSHGKSDHGITKDSSYDEVLNPNVKKLKTDTALAQSPILGLESFIKKQQEQWECSSCMTRNEQSNLKCACCEAAKPGAAQPAVASAAPPAAAPAMPKPLSNPPYSGMASFIQKQQEQWECSCCMSRNDQNRAKCVCCEAAKPGTQPAAAAAAQFNFGNTQNTFKFGIDKANDPGKTVTDGKVAEPAKTPDAPALGGGFMFGNPTTVSDTKTGSAPAGGFKFGVSNGSSPSITTTPVSKPNLMFGSKIQESSPAVPVSEFSFGIKKTEEKKVTETSIAPAEIKSNLFSFSSPKLANENKKEVESSQVNFAVTPIDNKAPPPLYSKPVDSTTPAATVPTTSVSSAPAFSFGAPASAINKPVFGNSTAFQFNSTASSPAAPVTTESSIKPGLFSFGVKPSAVPTNDNKPTTDGNTAPKPAFQLQSATSGSLFPSPTSQVTNNSVKSPLPSIGGGIQFNAPTASDKPKDQAAPAFFGFTSPTANSAGIGSSTFKSPASTLPAFSFGSASTTKVESAVPLFNAPTATSAPAPGIFGSKPAEPTMFKASPITTTSSFPAPSSNIFGSVQSVNSQLPASNMFGSGSLNATANKPPVAIFGSSALSTDTSSAQPSQANSLFSNPTMPAPSFNAGSIFGNTAQSGSVPPQTGNLFGNPVKSPSDAGSGMFMSNPQAAAPPSNMFGSAMAAAAPAQTSSTIFGSSAAVPTPVFGASIPFGEASQNQNVSFKFGASNSSGPPGVGFGGAPAPGGGTGGVFSFGSGAPAPPPTNSQFNFSMGAPASAFSNTPGAMANPAQRRIKKAVRRNVLR